MHLVLRLSSPSLDVLPLVAIADAVAGAAATGGDTPFHKATYKGKFRKLQDWVVDDARAGRLAVTDQDGRPGTFDEVVQRAKNDGTYSEVFEPSEEILQKIADGEPFSDALQDPASRKFDLNATHALCVYTTLKNLNDWASAQGNTFSISRVGWIDERGWIEPSDVATDRHPTTEPIFTAWGGGQDQIKPVYSGTGNTSVVFLINGREAIPVRAIPLVAPVPHGVRYLVEGLMSCDRSNAMHGLTAYQWSPGAKPALEVPPEQWMRVDFRLRALKASLERQESTELLSRDEGVERYNRDSISILPAGVFVWKDDFVNARTRNIRRLPEDEIVARQDSWRDHIRFLQQQLELQANHPDVDQWKYSLGEDWREQLAAFIADERALDPVPPESIVLYDRICCGQAPLTDVSFSPLVEADLRKKVMEGFEHLLPVEVPDQTSAMHGRESPGSVSSTSATDLPQSVINAIAVGYSDLLTLCSVDDEDDFGGYVVKKTGVYVKKHNKHAWSLLTPSEKAVLAWHPTGEYDKPALALPCTLEKLRAFVSDAGLAGCIDEEALQEIVELRTQTGDEIAQMLAGWFDSPIDDLPPKQRRIVELYIPSWQELSAADRRARAAEAYLRVLATRGARIKKARKKAEAANAAIPARFAEREFQDGFNRVQRTKNGERDFKAKLGAVNLSHERCIELGHSRELRIADWIELTGVGHGWCGAYLIGKEGVSFREWDDDYISNWPLDWQRDMDRDNEQPPLEFPCTPIELLHFVDTAHHDLYGFSVPDDFRHAVIAIEQAADTTPQVPEEAREQAAPSGTSENAAPADVSAAVDEDTATAPQVPEEVRGPAASPGTTEESKPATKTRTNKLRAILQYFIGAGVSPNIESIWLHIRVNAGKDHFPFKSSAADYAVHVDGERVDKNRMARALRSLLKTKEKNRARLTCA